METSFRKAVCLKLLLFLFIVYLKSDVFCADLTKPEHQSFDDANSELTINLCENCACDKQWMTNGYPKRSRSQPSPIPDLSDTCQLVLQNFSDSVAVFSRCLGMNARPITICQDCIEEFLDVDYWYKNISSGSGANCDVELLNRDHLQVVKTLAQQAEGYWSAAQCPNCYAHDGDDHPRICNDTLEFFDKLSRVSNCINDTQAINTDEHIRNTSEVCAKCRNDYIDLNEYYEKLNTKYSNRLCMDILDAMNITRHLWSSTYMCTSLQVEILPVILSSIGFLCLPVIYYCGNRFVANARDTKIVRPKRMSFVQTSYSSASLQR